MAVERTVHQLWKNARPPDLWEVCAREWETLTQAHGWEYKLWTDEDVDRLLTEEYSWVMPFYRKLSSDIQRVHLSRYILLYHFGGLCVDMDVQPRSDHVLSFLESGVRPHRVVVSLDPYTKRVGTGFLWSSERGHPLWKYVLYYCMQPRDRWDEWLMRLSKHMEVRQRTGPTVLELTLDRHKFPDVLQVDARWFQPMHNTDDSQWVTRVPGGPSWRDWDSTAIDAGHWLYAHRDWLLLGVVAFLLFTVFVLLVKRT